MSSPQHMAWSSDARTPHVCWAPAVMLLNSTPPAITVGALVGLADVPHCPWSLLPKHTTCPSKRSPQVCRAPHATPWKPKSWEGVPSENSTGLVLLAVEPLPSWNEPPAPACVGGTEQGGCNAPVLV